LQIVRYENNGGSIFPPVLGVRTLTIAVQDGQAVNGEGSAMLRVDVVDDPTTLTGPTMTIIPDTVEAAADETPVKLAAGLTLVSSGVPTIEGAIIQIGANFLPGEDVLHAANLPDEITAEFDESMGILYLHGVAPLNYYEWALQNITYVNHATVRDGL